MAEAILKAETLGEMGFTLPKLPLIISNDRSLNLLQTNWSAILNPIIQEQLLQNNLLQNISLNSGYNIINHKLGRNLIGWFVVRQRADANFYDVQDSNQTPDLTLVLHSSAGVSVDLIVF